MINVNDNLIKQDLSVIGAEAFAVLMAITIHLNKDRTAFPGIKRLMAITGLSRNKVYRGVKTLVDNKYLDKRQESGAAEGERNKFGKIIYKVTTKHLALWMPVDDFELEEIVALPENEEAQNAQSQNGTISINKKGSINNEEDFVVPAETTPPPTKTKLQKRLNCKNAKYETAVIQIVDYFNSVTGRVSQYHTAGALSLMLYWLNEGYSIDDFKAVIDFKTKLFTDMKKPENISLDTYCRKTTFEDNLEKAKRPIIPAAESENLKDIELTEDEISAYNELKNQIKSKFPETYAKVAFFTYSEFRQFRKREFYRMFQYQYTESTFQRRMAEAFRELETKPWLRKDVKLFPYIKNYLISHKDAI